MIRSRVVRVMKNRGANTRHFLQGFARGSPPVGGDLYAATPSVCAWRFLLAIASSELKECANYWVLAGDVSQAFPHADIDVSIATTIPMDLDGLVLTNGSETWTLVGGEPVIVRKAQYGYRKSPQLWQKWLGSGLVSVGLTMSVADPMICYSLETGVRMVFHVDDLLFFGPAPAVETVFASLQGFMRLREVGRMAKTGDQRPFFNRQMRRTATGFTVRGNLKVLDALVTRCGLQQAKYIATPAPTYSTNHVEEATSTASRTQFRSVTGGVMHVAHDRPDAQWATKEAARAMSTTLDEWRIPRVVRYLKHHRLCVKGRSTSRARWRRLLRFAMPTGAARRCRGGAPLAVFSRCRAVRS